MADLSLQLAIVMVGRQISTHLMEIGIPFLQSKKYEIEKYWKSGKRVSSEVHLEGKAQWLSDFYLVDYGRMGILFEYLDMGKQNIIDKFLKFFFINQFLLP